jgi:hypothetical protein
MPTATVLLAVVFVAVGSPSATALADPYYSTPMQPVGLHPDVSALVRHDTHSMLMATSQQMYQTPGNMSRYSLSPDSKPIP